MKNIYRVNGREVLAIITKTPSKTGKRKISFFVLDDGSEVKANGTMVEIKCTDCGNFFSYSFAMRYEKKPYLCNHCRVDGSRNPFFGKHHSEENKLAQSKRMTGKFVGEKNPMFGKPCYYKMTEEEKKSWKNNISTSHLGEKNAAYGKNYREGKTQEELDLIDSKKSFTLLNKPKEEKERISKLLSDAQKRLQAKDPIAYSKMKSKGGHIASSKQSKYKQSLPEKLVEEWLKANNVDYDYSCIMGSGNSCFQYDFIIHGKRILIEVQGDYWHANPKIFNVDGSDGKRKMNRIQMAKVEKDQKKFQFAKEKNFEIIYIWESEVKNKDFSKLRKLL